MPQLWPTIELKNGLCRPRGRHSRIEHRLQAAIGDISVQWLPSHRTAQQAAELGVPAAYVSGNAEADLLAGKGVQDVPAIPPELSLFRRRRSSCSLLLESFKKIFRPRAPRHTKSRRTKCPTANGQSFSRLYHPTENYYRP
eukprot:5743512-Amphidinium_carterae.1